MMRSEKKMDRMKTENVTNAQKMKNVGVYRMVKTFVNVGRMENNYPLKIMGETKLNCIQKLERTEPNL